MSTASELRAGLEALAQRSVGIMAACANEESAKLYLVLPFITLLGYDATNPYEVYPNHLAADPTGTRGGVDFAILRGADPIIAIEVDSVGADLKRTARALRHYFDAARTPKLAIATDGIVYDLYVDVGQSGRLDAEPFLTFDLEGIARCGADEQILGALAAITKGNFDPAAIAELAHIMIVGQRLRTIFVEETKTPSEAFCRYALGRIGLAAVPASAIERHYAPMISAAFEDALVVPLAERLRGAGLSPGGPAATLQPVEQRLARVERERSLLTYVRRRLAFLVETEAHFAGLDDVHMKDYVGRTSFYYSRERKGRLFDLVEAADGHHKYVFPDPIGSIATNRIADIDEALKAVYEARIHEMGSISLQPRKTRVA